MIEDLRTRNLLLVLSACMVEQLLLLWKYTIYYETIPIAQITSQKTNSPSRTHSYPLKCMGFSNQYCLRLQSSAELAWSPIVSFYCRRKRTTFYARLTPACGCLVCRETALRRGELLDKGKRTELPG